MGGGAVKILNKKNVEVVVGTSVETYLQGSLKSTGSVCHEHQHQINVANRITHLYCEIVLVR